MVDPLQCCAPAGHAEGLQIVRPANVARLADPNLARICDLLLERGTGVTVGFGMSLPGLLQNVTVGSWTPEFDPGVLQKDR